MTSRLATLVLCGMCWGCASQRSFHRFEFGPDTDDSVPEGTNLSFGQIPFAADPFKPHQGCVTTSGAGKGIVRCPGAGHLSWIFMDPSGTGAGWSPGAYIEQRDLVEQELAAFAHRNDDSIKRADYPCDIGSVPGTCRAYVLEGSAGTIVDVVGVSTFNSSLVECLTRPGGAMVMLPVCRDVIQAQRIEPKKN
jgi:hypothetical protein